jgi:hypothetical protein
MDTYFNSTVPSSQVVFVCFISPCAMCMLIPFLNMIYLFPVFPHSCHQRGWYNYTKVYHPKPHQQSISILYFDLSHTGYIFSFGLYCIHLLLRPVVHLLGGIPQRPVVHQHLRHGFRPATWLHHHQPTVMGVTGGVISYQ